MRVWSDGAMQALQDCFEYTDWDMLKPAATYNDHLNIDEYAMSVSAYINKCRQDVSASKFITTRAKQKPCDEVHKMLKARNSAFKSGKRWHWEQQEPALWRKPAGPPQRLSLSWPH